ncbi:primosomal protein N' family DNA-binding protein [Parenemella sanctibonifatiensis]|uniref:primosomal protein N' family DNA-binding protein n=1 Tax=Parenemella sanctibonifatiensis TaxID=2016505 RepID=UPI0015C5918F|nr:primosome assembly protein PriA [Parenemella sanctibonifatiensis]
MTPAPTPAADSALPGLAVTDVDGSAGGGSAGGVSAVVPSGSSAPSGQAAPGLPVAASVPVAKVMVDVSLAHLDRPFDYRIPDSMSEVAPGCRVRVRFAGRLRDGWVLEVGTAPDTDRLQPLERLISTLPVLTPGTQRLIRTVADHQAGMFADVVRLALPPRHAATETAMLNRWDAEPDPIAAPTPRVWAHYPNGAGLLTALAGGGSPRAAWLVNPGAAESGDWTGGLIEAAAATASSGRTALILVPSVTEVEQVMAACETALGAKVAVDLHADLGPSARYRRFLAILAGHHRIVVGTRAAAFAPLPDLGLVAMWDDGNDLYAEPRAPYPHAREVAGIAAAHAGAGIIYASRHRSTEVQRLVETGWLEPVSLPREGRRRDSPVVRAAIDTEQALVRDLAGRAARLPHRVFTVVRASLAQGPVLFQVPRGGYRLGLTCQDCRARATCLTCHGPLQQVSANAPLSCTWCGRLHPNWHCTVCGSGRLRAPVAGAGRSVEELGRAFPGVRVRQSSGDSILTEVGEEPCIVVATPGAEPRAAGGYAAAILTDVGLMLAREDLRSAEEALRRWWNAIGLVRPATEDGTVVVLGEPDWPIVQSLIRNDSEGFAATELAERREAGFPPAVRLCTITGEAGPVADFARLLTEELAGREQQLAELPPAGKAAGGDVADAREPDPGVAGPPTPAGARTDAPGGVDIMGPAALPPSNDPRQQSAEHQLTLRSALPGAELRAAVKRVAGVRAARKQPAVRIRMDPAEL